MDMTISPRGWGSPEKPWPVAVTDLDSWKYYMESDVMTMEDLRRRLSRSDPENAKMVVGRCFHAAVEQLMLSHGGGAPAPVNVITGAADGRELDFRFAADLSVELQHYATAERDLELMVETPHGWVQLRGVVDGIYGSIARDIKITASQMVKAIERFNESWQWRTYLLALGDQYKQFEYHVFKMKLGQDAEFRIEQGESPTVPITDYARMTCYRYPAMMDDLQSVLSEIAAWFQSVDWNPVGKRTLYAF